jgi:transposase-like protein
MTRKTRRQFSPEKRATILRRHLVDKVAVSDLCDEHGIQPSLFYTWQKQLFENMESVLHDARHRRAGVKKTVGSPS